MRARLPIIACIVSSLVVSNVATRGVPRAAASTPSVAAGADIRYVHDSLGRLVAAIDPAGSTTRDTYDPDGNATSVRTQSSSLLAVDQVTPATAAAGAQVSVDGTGFSATPSADTVRFAGVAATVVSASVDHLVVTVPASAAAGRISVQTTAGTVTGAQTFTPAAAVLPKITALSPARSAVGATLTITGKGFDPAVAHDDVRINRTRAVVRTATSTKLTATVPLGVSSGPVSVSTPSGSATSTTTLFVEPYNTVLEPLGQTSTITVGGTVAVALTSPNTSAVATFVATAGEHIIASLSKESTSGGTFELLDPRADPVAGGGSFDAGVTTSFDARLAEPGRYSLYVDFGGVTGTATLGLASLPDVSLTDPTSASVTATATLADQDVTVAVPGIQNHRLSLTVTKASLSGGTVDTTLEAPDGATVQQASEISGVGFVEPDTILPFTGTYRIRLHFADHSGTLTFTPHDVRPDASGTLTVDGPSQQVTIADPGQNAAYSVTGTAEERVALRVTPGTLPDPAAEIDGPDGTALWSGTDWSDEVTLPSAGNYTVRLDPDGPDTGTVTLKITTVPADLTGTLLLGAAAKSLTFTGAGQHAVLSFAGTKNQTVELTTGAFSGPDGAAILVTDPAGDYIYSSSVGTDPDDSGALTLGATGTYHVVYDPELGDTGTLTARLTSATPATTTGRPRSTPRPTTPTTTVQPPVSSAVRSYRSPYSDAYAPTGIDQRAHHAPSPWQSTPLAHATPGVTALAGRVLTIAGLPLRGVTLSLGDAVTRSDATGRFLLTNTPFGRHTMTIDATTANRAGHTYGRYETLVDATGGATSVLPFTIWMTRLDTAHTVAIGSPTRARVTVTNPRIPGLQVQLPKGSTIRDDDGDRVRRIGITPIPVDRPPFPLPLIGVNLPLYFTVQPGGAYVDPAGAQIVYPNWTHLRPGTTSAFWDYDPDRRGWYTYGTGHVTANGKQVVPDRGTRVWEFSGAMFGGGQAPPSNGPTCPPHDAGDPVSCSTGLLEQDHTDLSVPDVIPVDIARNYRQSDSNDYAFGAGTNFNYGIWLTSQQTFSEVDLIRAHGERVHFTRISGGSAWQDAVFLTRTPGDFNGSTMVAGPTGWDLTTPTGTVYEFGLNGPLQFIRDRYGNQTDLIRDGSGGFTFGTGDIVRIIAPNGRWVSLDYTGASGFVSSVTDLTGRAVHYSYDGNGDLTKVTDARTDSTTYGYDSAHRMVSVKDARGTVTSTFTYDAANRVKSETLADGGVWNFAYTPATAGQITTTRVTDPRGHVEVLTFDAAGYATTVTRASGTSLAQKTTYNYDANHWIVGITDPLGRTTVNGYDTVGRLSRQTLLSGTASARTTTAAYDGFGDVTALTDPLSHATTATYDPLGRLLVVTDANGNVTHVTDNPDGQPATMTTPAGHTTTFAYTYGDLTSTATPTTETSRAYVGAGGHPVLVTDPLGRRWNYAYDANWNLTGETDPLGGTTTLVYDADNDLTGYTDPRGNTSHWNYNSLDLVSGQTDPLGRSTAVTYDLNDNLASSTDARGLKTAYTYDALDRPATVGFGETTIHPAPTSTTAYTYDAGDHLLKAVDSADGTISQSWDLFDEVTGETTSAGTIGYSYDAAGRRLTMTEPGAAAVTYSYDPGGRLSGTTQGAATATTAYDTDSNPITITLPGGVTRTATYDADDRATALTFRHASTTLGTDTYGYDAASERTSAGGTLSNLGASTTITSATYDAANELVNLNGAAATYDKDGNLTADATRTYAWNDRDQLTATTGAGAQTYTYDAFGRRATRTAGSATTSYVYDGLNAIQERSGTSISASMLDGPGLDEHYSRTDSSGTHSYLTDALDTTLALANSAGAISTTYSYSPFGAVTTGGTPSTNPYQFTGLENDGNGLTYDRARYLSVGTARFISADPLGLVVDAVAEEQPGESDSVNSYEFVGDDPSDTTDSLGLMGYRHYIEMPGVGDPEYVSKMAAYIAWYLKQHATTDSRHFWKIFNNVSKRAERGCEEVIDIARPALERAAEAGGETLESLLANPPFPFLIIIILTPGMPGSAPRNASTLA